MRLFCCLLVVISCKVTRNVSDDKFKPMVPGFHNLGDHFNNMAFLIKKVHAKELTIAYGFTNDNRKQSYRSSDHCHVSKQTSELKEKLVQTMTEILNLWLEPLRHQDYGGDKIVKKFVFTYIPAVRDHKSDGWVINSKRGASFDLEVIFSCGEQSLPMVPSGAGTFSVITPSLIIGVKAKSWGDDEKFAPYVHERSYSKPEMIVSFGLAFGLKDNPPDVVSATEIKLQDNNRNLILSDDDRKGIRWLYKYHHDVVDSCLFDDYKLVITNKSYGSHGHMMKCIPKNPMIVMVKQAHQQESWANFASAEQIIKEVTYRATDTYRTENWLDNSDDLGNTLLHYVAHYQQWSQQQSQLRKKNNNLSEAEELALLLPDLWKELAQQLIEDCLRQQRGTCQLLQKTNKENSTPCHYRIIAQLAPEDCQPIRDTVTP